MVAWRKPPALPPPAPSCCERRRQAASRGRGGESPSRRNSIPCPCRAGTSRPRVAHQGNARPNRRLELPPHRFERPVLNSGEPSTYTLKLTSLATVPPRWCNLFYEEGLLHIVHFSTYDLRHGWRPRHLIQASCGTCRSARQGPHDTDICRH